MSIGPVAEENFISLRQGATGFEQAFAQSTTFLKKDMDISGSFSVAFCSSEGWISP